MRFVAYALIFLVVGCVLSLAPVMTLCRLPYVRFSNACGHNAIYCLIISVPIGFLVSLFGTVKLAQTRKRLK